MKIKRSLVFWLVIVILVGGFAGVVSAYNSGLD